MHHLPDLAPVRRTSTSTVLLTGRPTGSQTRASTSVPARGRSRAETGAVSAEYATVTACGVGIGGVLLKLLTSDWGQALLKSLFEFFLKMLGIG